MTRIKNFFKIVVLDVLAVTFMIVALLIGWLPGPGGIPLFLAGLALLAINHEWAERYIDLLREYADKLGDIIFRPRLRLFYDLLAPTLIVWGFYILVSDLYYGVRASGVSLVALGIVVFLGNRDRWGRLKKQLIRKH